MNDFTAEEIVIPSMHEGLPVTDIGAGAFSDCFNLSSITIPEGIKTIQPFAFYFCVKLSSVELPNSVTHIGKEAFSACSNLTSITLGENVCEIADDAFYLSDKIIEIYNKSSLSIKAGENGYGGIALHAKDVYTSMDEKSNLTETSDGFIFYNEDGNYYLMGHKRNVRLLELPSSIKGNGYSIYPNAFAYSLNLESIVLPNSVKEIQENAFLGCYVLIEVKNDSALTIVAGS
ncbi:MAG: leucine-rich repeat protein, partial [Clostridia bacterium]|nr:leucine-rich repeat protein [Clostridia bacterium]